MTLYKKREKFNSLSIKIGMIFSRIPLSPNQWTTISLIPAALGLILAYSGNIAAAVVLFGLAAFFDIIDGSVARVIGKVTRLGAYLDTIIDRYIEFVMILSILFLNLPGVLIPTYIWILLLLFGSMMSTYAKSASAEKNIIKKEGHGIKGGILEHADRLIVLFLIFFLSLLINKIYITYLVIIMAILSNLSAFQRIYYVWSFSRTRQSVG